MLNKSLLTNLLAFLICVGGYFSPAHGDLIFMTGMFALSGSITNWLAIHMLFERVPLLYGSGVIPNRFEEFKAAIKSLIIEQFFTREHIEKFFSDGTGQTAEKITDTVDFDRVFSGLTDAIAASELGSMLSMVGGKKALEPLREPVTEKLKDIVTELVAEKSGAAGNTGVTSTLISKVEHIVDNRLEELTPEHVKEIVQEMIKTHLGWLVVWGGVFGAVIGLAEGLLG